MTAGHGVRPGGRTARVRAAVIAATYAELAERGMDGLTVDAVATRAGVHRTTVHRRWGDVGGLLAAALDASTDDDWAPPDTGSLEGDLASLAEEVRVALAEPDSVSAAVIAASFRSAAAAEALRRFLDDRYARCVVVVERARERGEVASSCVSLEVLVAATAPVYHHALLLGRVPDAAAVRRYAQLAAGGAAG